VQGIAFGQEKLASWKRSEPLFPNKAFLFQEQINALHKEDNATYYVLYL